MLTGRQLGLSAILANNDDWDRTIDLCLRANDPDFDIAMRRRYGASCLSQPPKPGCYSYAAVSGFGGA